MVAMHSVLQRAEDISGWENVEGVVGSCTVFSKLLHVCVSCFLRVLFCKIESLINFVTNEEIAPIKGNN